jgi:hypothetical protein
MPELTVVVPVAEPLLDRMAGHLDDVAGRIPEIVELPDWIDPSLLRSAVVAAIVISLVLLVVAARLIRRLVVRMMVVLVLAALAAGLWSQRMELADCAVECSCALFGQAVLVPVDVNPNC